MWCNLPSYKLRLGSNVDACSIHSIFQFHDEEHAHSVIFSLRCGGLQICSHKLLMVEIYLNFHSRFPLRSNHKYSIRKRCCHVIEFELDLTDTINETFPNSIELNPWIEFD